MKKLGISLASHLFHFSKFRSIKAITLNSRDKVANCKLGQ